MKKTTFIIAGIVSLLFGLVTIFEGGSVILDIPGARESHGDFIWFVVWANVICAFFYIASSYGFFKLKNWTKSLLKISIIILVLTFAGLLIWIFLKNPFEKKTVIAMTGRLIVTVILFIIAAKTGKKKLAEE